MNEIIILPPEERVRRRPAVIFGDVGLEGSKRVFTDMLKILLAEVYHGQCSRIKITLYKDGTIDLVTNGRGFRVGTGDQWKDLFLVLPVKSAYAFLLDETIFSLYDENTDFLTKKERRFYDDLSLPCIQYVCKHMECIVYKAGKMHDFRFEKGISTSAKSLSCDPQKQSMHISFMIDPEVFSQHILPPDFVIEVSRTAATRMSGLLVSVKVETDDGWNEHIFGRERKEDSRKEINDEIFE